MDLSALSEQVRRHESKPASLKDIGVEDLDPWGNAYVLDTEGERLSVRSYGPDGRRHTADDLVSYVD